MVVNKASSFYLYPLILDFTLQYRFLVKNLPYFEFNSAMTSEKHKIAAKVNLWNFKKGPQAKSIIKKVFRPSTDKTYLICIVTLMSPLLPDELIILYRMRVIKCGTDIPVTLQH